MTDSKCPICESTQHQSFWHWDKEETLMREWAMDTQVHFSICRACACIFQNPLEPPRPEADDLGGMWAMDMDDAPIADEPLDWVQQFGSRGMEPCKALEIYTGKKRFEPYLVPKGWQIKAISLHQFLDNSELAEKEGESNVEGIFQTDKEITSIEDNEQFDMAFCFDALEQTHQPMQLLQKLHKHVKDDGALYTQVSNPLVLPRYNQFSFTSAERVQYPFRTLIYMLYKAGFANQGAEMNTKTRCICNKVDPATEAEPGGLIPNDTWGMADFRVRRNYYWNWGIRYLENYMKQVQSNPDHLQETRNQLAQNPLERHIIRDLCGSCLLFMQEVDQLKNTISHDWPVTMSRVFNIMKYDYAMYDLLKVGGFETVNTLPEVGRYYINDKMVYMTDTDFFEKYFTMDEANTLCQSIIQSGQVVCGHLSSML